jgi:hypothetical protein
MVVPARVPAAVSVRLAAAGPGGVWLLSIDLKLPGELSLAGRLATEISRYAAARAARRTEPGRARGRARVP